MKKEIEIIPMSGYNGLLILLLLVIGSVAGFIVLRNPMVVLLLLGVVYVASGFFFINPNGSVVLTLFGEYKGTVKENGFFWANPFYIKKKISLRIRNFDSEKLKVNDKNGNPIVINAILVWKIQDAFKAAFEVNDYESFVKIQCDSALRKLAGLYPYDNFDDNHSEATLRSGVIEVNTALEKEMQERLSLAGVEVIEARIGYLAYAQEIAGAMLKRQQASAVVAARMKIVEGAVGMVDAALHELSAKNIIELDDDKKAAMVSNLMVVLCSDKDTTPIVNTGTLYQ
jgi:regulator of protease activity HflC (stomatin/prohibitin superfamily)